MPCAKKLRLQRRPESASRFSVTWWSANEAGEVTVAWVVLIAATLVLTVGVLSSVGGGTQDLSDDMRSELSQQEL